MLDRHSVDEGNDFGLPLPSKSQKCFGVAYAVVALLLANCFYLYFVRFQNEGFEQWLESGTRHRKLQETNRDKSNEVGSLICENRQESANYYIPIPLEPDGIFDPTAENPGPNYTNNPAVRAYQRGITSWELPILDESVQNLEPLVSVIMPYYNAHDYIDETLIALKAQTLERFEIVLVNDLSTNPLAVEKLNELKQTKDKRLRVLEAPKKLGLSGARNFGVVMARSNYVFWCDPDDLLEPTTLEKMYWFLESFPMYGWVGAFTVGFGENEYLWKKNFQYGDAILNLNVAHVAALVRRDWHLEVDGFDEEVGVFEDWDYWMRMANKGHWGHTIPEYLCWYRNKKTSLVSGENSTWRTIDRSVFAKNLQIKYPHAYDQFPTPKAPDTFANGLEYHLKDNEETLLHKVMKGFRNRRRNLQAKQTHTFRKRILLMIPWMKPGGADEINLAIAEQMAVRHKWDISILATTIYQDSDMDQMLHHWKHYDSCGGIGPRFERFTSDIFCISSFMSFSNITSFVEYLFHTRKPSIVLISHSDVAYRLLPWMRTSFPETYFVDLIHIVEREWRSGGYPFFSILFEPFLDQIITISSQLKDWLIERGVSAEKISIYYFVYELIDCSVQMPGEEQRRAVRSKYGLSDQDVVIIFVGRFVKQKRPQLVLSIAQAMTSFQDLRFFSWKIVMIGDGHLMEQVHEKYVASSELRKHVILLGNTPHEDTLDLLQVSDVFLLPSDNEGISIATAEAMSFGLSIVCSDVGAQSELVKPEYGYLIPFEDSSKNEISMYADRLQSMIKNPQGRQKMGLDARDEVCLQEIQDLTPMFCRAAETRPNFPPPDAFIDYMISVNTYLSFEDIKRIRSIEDYRKG